MDVHSGDEWAVPELALAFFGYDRAQVDEYVARLIDWAQEAEDRVAAAEQDAATLRSELEALAGRNGPAETRVADDSPDVTAAAHEQADRILATARAEADKILFEAHLERKAAAECLEAARNQAGGIRESTSALSQLSDELDRVLERLAELEQELTRPSR